LWVCGFCHERWQERQLDSHETLVANTSNEGN
jgi:hypothetical protein